MTEGATFDAALLEDAVADLRANAQKLGRPPR